MGVGVGREATFIYQGSKGWGRMGGGGGDEVTGLRLGRAAERVRQYTITWDKKNE